MKSQLSSPPATPIEWVALRVHTELAPKPLVVTARTWFEARSLAMAELGCGPGDIVVSPNTGDLGKAAQGLFNDGGRKG